MDSGRNHGDVVVVGAPRSGTSLVAQLLVGAGLRAGEDLLPATDANPLGFVEQISVSELNDALLAPHVVGSGHGQVPVARLAWLAAPAGAVRIEATEADLRTMHRLLPPSPAVVKDPRFTVTLDAWRPALRPATSFVAVVRDPAEVGASLATMARRDPEYYDGFALTPEVSMALWAASARRLLSLRETGRWFVVDHASLLDGSAIEPMSRFVHRPLDRSQVQATLHRSRPGGRVPEQVLALAKELRAIAADDVLRWGHG